ncbi:MAG: HAD family phosphatase [Thermoplasmata archaeon]|nr:HAD family phosphatase [Thermoplasmata archaeon]
MAEPSILLWDIGGVLLSNGWEESFREQAARQFGFDLAEFERRHRLLDAGWERGELSMDQYLDRTLFYEPRSFSRPEFAGFMFGRSSPHPEVLALAQRLRANPANRLSCLNNEPRELNEYRIANFGLYRLFESFFSSCYTGRRKPDPSAYRLVVDVLRRPPSEIVFIDDRPENLAPARALGMHTVHYQTPAQLEGELQALGVRA